MQHECNGFFQREKYFLSVIESKGRQVSPVCPLLNGVDSRAQTIWRLCKQLYERKTNKQTNPSINLGVICKTHLRTQDALTFGVKLKV